MKILFALIAVSILFSQNGFNVTIGLNNNVLKGWKPTDSENKPSFYFGGGYNHESYGLDILYDIKRINIEPRKKHYSFHYLTISPKYRYNFKRFTFFAGPKIGFKTSSTKHFDDINEIHEELNVKSRRYSAVLGMAYHCDNITITGAIDYAMNSLYKNAKSKLSSIQLGMSYTFN